MEKYRYISNVRKDFYVLIRKRDLKIILLLKKHQYCVTETQVSRGKFPKVHVYILKILPRRPLSTNVLILKLA